MSGQGRSCRSRSTRHPSTRCMPNGAASRRDRRRAERGARQRRPHRRGRHHLVAAAGKRRRGRWHHPAVHRRDRDLHHAGLSFPRGRYSADQFSSAALDAVHAGVGVFRARHHEAGLCARDREGYRFYSYGDACLPGRPTHMASDRVRAINRGIHELVRYFCANSRADRRRRAAVAPAAGRSA